MSFRSAVCHLTVLIHDLLSLWIVRWQEAQVGLGNALRWSATGKEHSSLWWHGMRSAQTTFNQSFLSVWPSHNCLSLKPTCLMSNTVKRFSKGEFAPCQVKNVLRWRAKLFPCVWAFRFWRYKVYFNWWTSSLRLNCFKQRKRWRNLPSMTSRYGFIICFNGLSSSVLKHLLWLDLICVHGA